MHTSKYNIQNTAKQLLAGGAAPGLVVPQGNKTVRLVGRTGDRRGIKSVRIITL